MGNRGERSVVANVGQGTRMGSDRIQRGGAGAGDGAGDGEVPRIVLASRSARRRELLAHHGYAFDVVESGFDDGGLSPGAVNAEAWVMSLAFLKASAAADLEDADNPRGVVLGADTVCVKEGVLFGQPIDEQDAARMIREMSNSVHDVVTGVALLCVKRARRVMFCDRSRVTVGEISEAQIAEYVASGAWRGKAGGYNLSERLEAGWPIEYEGDASSIMGLPMEALRERLARFCEDETDRAA